MPPRNRGRAWAVLGILLGAGVIGGVAWWLSQQRTPTVVADPARYFSDGTERQRPEFQRIAQRLYQNSEFFRRGIADNLDKQRRGQEHDIDAWLGLTYSYVEWLLWEGRVEEAVVAAEAMVARAQTQPGRLEQQHSILRMRALAYLRHAEVENCIRRHNRDCCVFPLQGGGVHTGAPQFVEQARADYLRLMELRPLLDVRWLLNITNMAAGRSPEDLPAAYRLPHDTHAVQGRIGRFVDVGVAAGVAPLNLAGGSIADDFDGDGLLDIVTSSSEPEGPIHFYRNSGDGTFEDRSDASRLSDQLGGLNLVSTDYDNDGDIDIFVLRGAWLFESGQIRNSLLQNNGRGVFTDVTRAVGLHGGASPTQAGAWFDYDNDGDLDLFVGNESRLDRGAFPDEPVGLGDYPSQLFRNDGAAGFVDVASIAGVTNDGYCKGVAVGDFDNDGWMDIYVSNVGPNRLYRNRGDGTFTDVATQAGVREPAGRSFATWFFDYDHDGWLDLFVVAYDARIQDIAVSYLGKPSHATAPSLYRNRGDGTFENVTSAVGLARPFLPMGANFGDLDGDGWLDLYLATGEPSYEALMPDVVLCNEEGRFFSDVTQESGLGHLQKGHGVSFADFDNDGDQDVYHQLGGFFPGDRFHNALFVNPGHGNHWLKISLVGRRSNRLGYGARVRVAVKTADGTRVLHHAPGAVSSFGGSPSDIEMGLGKATEVEWIEVDWPVTGKTQRCEKLPIDCCIEIVEGLEFRAFTPPKFSLRR